jgi:hypothetical protein
MPEFILDTAGVVSVDTRVSEGRAPGTSHPVVITAWRDLDAFTQGYVEALFFTEADVLAEQATKPGAIPFEPSFGFSDLAPETLARIVADCAAFRATLDWRVFEADRGRGTASDDQAGQDFWFTRNGHGVGFWDRAPYVYGASQVSLTEAARAFGNVNAYLGDDGRVYL